MVAHAEAHERNQPSLRLAPEHDMVPLHAFRGGLSGNERDALFLNPGTGRFVEAGYVRGVDSDLDGRAVLPFDPDGDGDLDLAVLSLQGLRVLENRTPPAAFARVRLEGPAEGAVVRLTAGRTQVQRADSVVGFHTLRGRDLHFGLGSTDRIDAIAVTWPDGKSETWRDLPVGQRIRLARGRPAVTEPLRAWPSETRPRTVAFDPKAPVLTLDGASEPVVGQGATLINVWAPSCAACADELPVLDRLDVPGVRVVAVSAQVEPEPVRAFAQKLGLKLPVRLASEAFVRAYFDDAGQIPLPTTFVVDAEGRLRRTIRRPLSEAELRRVALSLKP